MAEIGDVFGVSLGDGRIVVGQIVAQRTAPAPCLIAVWHETFSDTGLPSLQQLRDCIHCQPIILANSFDSLVDTGEWKKLGNLPPGVEPSSFPAFRNVIGGLPFSFTVTSYDLKYTRAAFRLRELFAPGHYSISAKGLENAIKAYFGVTPWNAKRYDRLLYNNIVPFGKLRGKHKPEAPLGHLVFAKIIDKALPMARGSKYERPLDEALRSSGFGTVTGGGTQTNREHGIEWVGLDIELSNLDEAVEFARQKLRELGAPPGSVLEYRIGEKKISVPIA